MSEQTKTLWGFPVVESKEIPKGEIIFGRLPTSQEILAHGSFENAVQHMKNEYYKLKLADETLNATEIE